MNLKDLLSPELYEQVQARIDEANAGQTDKTKQIRFADLSEGRYVSVDRFNSQRDTLNQQITDLTEQITQRDNDLADLNTRLTAAQNDAAELENVRGQVTSLQEQYNADKQDWENKLAEQKYTSAVRERSSAIRFSSPAAQRDFIRSVTEKKLQMDGDTLLGYDDFLTKYAADNPGAIVTEPEPDDGQTPPPTITLPTTKPGAGEKSVFGFHFGGVRPHSDDE